MNKEDYLKLRHDVAVNACYLVVMRPDLDIAPWVAQKVFTINGTGSNSIKWGTSSDIEKLSDEAMVEVFETFLSEDQFKNYPKIRQFINEWKNLQLSANE